MRPCSGTFLNKHCHFLDISNLLFSPIFCFLLPVQKFARDREKELNACYKLVDHDKKGYISKQDIERLSTIVGEPMSLSEAQTLLEQSALSRTGDYEPSSAPVSILRQGDFERIFNPPESKPQSF